MFWTLFDQKVTWGFFFLSHHNIYYERKLIFANLFKGSRWTLQATTMDGDFVSFVKEPAPTINVF